MTVVDADGEETKKSWGYKIDDNGNYVFSTDILTVDGQPVTGGSDSSEICVKGYTPLSHIPEIMTATRRIAELIGSITIHLMDSTPNGDVRIKNELSRMIDITPTKNMNRAEWVQAFVETMLLHGRGNAIVLPKTRGGILTDLEPISAARVNFMPIGYSDYKVMIDGHAHDPDEVLHFRYNPDRFYLWKGDGVTVQLRDVAESLRQASETTKGFMKSKWKPSVIIKVDALDENFSSKEGRRKCSTITSKPKARANLGLFPERKFKSRR